MIRYDTDVATDGPHGAGHVFVIRDTADEALALVSARLDNSGRAVLGNRRVDRGITTDVSEAIDQALLAYVVRRLNSLLSDPSSRAELLGAGGAAWNLGVPDVGELARLLDKHCAYQITSTRDWYCSAASPHDPTEAGRDGLTILAPTSRRLCGTCDLPDASYLCSHLMHPQVTATAVAEDAPLSREVISAMCELGRPEIAQPGRCRAGGNACWERVATTVETAVAELPPFALTDAIDMLEMAWRLAFGRSQRLLALRSTVDTAGLEQSAADRDAFRARIENLADVIMNLQVDDALIPPTATQQDRGGSLNRMQTVLASKLADADLARDLVSPIRQVLGLRRGLTHSPAASEIPSRAAALGITWPPADWSATWAQVKATTVEALRALRHELVRLAEAP